MTLARIGRFDVVRALGSGAFSSVWLARDEDLDTWVAIKLLAENWALHEDARRRFAMEARALRLLDNDHIVRVYEVGQLADGRPYMVMELADLGTLEDRMRLRASLGQPISVREALGLGLGVAECLVAVHDMAIVHRDVKPSNVLFRSVSKQGQEAMRRDGQVVQRERTMLGDFGVARWLEGTLGHTVVVGSPQYMSSEQADPARAHLVDERSDIYSAAVVLFEMIAGRPPRMGKNGPVDRIQAMRPDVPVVLSAAIQRGLAADPSDRFSSAREWREALRGVREEGGALMGDEATLAGSRSEAGGPRVATRPLDTETKRGAAVGTLPVPATVRTTPLPIPSAQDPPAAASLKGLRVLGVVLALAGVAAFTGAFLPWVTIRSSGELSEDRLGIAFRAGSPVLAGAILLFLAGARIWMTRRRWVALIASLMSSVVGLGLGLVGLYELVVIQGRVRGTLRGSQQDAAVALGPGVVVTLAAAWLAFLMGWVAIRRMRSLRRRGVHPMLRLP